MICNFFYRREGMYLRTLSANILVVVSSLKVKRKYNTNK